MAFFSASAFSCSPPVSSASLISDALTPLSKCTSIVHPRSTTALRVAMMALDRVRAPRQARFLRRSCDKRETATSTRKTETTATPTALV